LQHAVLERVGLRPGGRRTGHLGPGGEEPGLGQALGHPGQRDQQVSGANGPPHGHCPELTTVRRRSTRRMSVATTEAAATAISPARKRRPGRSIIAPWSDRRSEIRPTTKGDSAAPPTLIRKTKIASAVARSPGSTTLWITAFTLPTYSSRKKTAPNRAGRNTLRLGLSSSRSPRGADTMKPVAIVRRWPAGVRRVSASPRKPPTTTRRRPPLAESVPNQKLASGTEKRLTRWR